MSVISIDFPAARLEREKIIISIAALIDANPCTCNLPGVQAFAEEVRFHGADFFYCSTIESLCLDHAEALDWAKERLADIPDWRAAMFGKDEGVTQ